MSEHNESIIRQQALLMFTRNQGREYVNKRVMKRFMRCIRIAKDVQLKIFN